MDPVLQRIEALPGGGRFALTFAGTGSGELTSVVSINDTQVDLAEANFPLSWSGDAERFGLVASLVQAFEAARAGGPQARRLHDVDGGWDVSLGNVILGDSGIPDCQAHGPMSERADYFVCEQCDARAVFG